MAMQRKKMGTTHNRGRSLHPAVGKFRKTPSYGHFRKVPRRAKRT